EDTGRDGHASFDNATEAYDGAALDHAKQISTQDGAPNAAHATKDDHRQTLQLDLVTADVGTDVGEGDAKEQSGKAAKCGRDEEGRGEDAIDVDPEQGRRAPILGHGPQGAAHLRE